MASELVQYEDYLFSLFAFTAFDFDLRATGKEMDQTFPIVSQALPPPHAVCLKSPSPAVIVSWSLALNENGFTLNPNPYYHPQKERGPVAVLLL